MSGTPSGGSLGRRDIRRRVVLLVGVGALAPMVVFAWISASSLLEMNRQLRQERLSLAASLAAHVDHVVREHLQSLSAVPADVATPAADVARRRAALRAVALTSRLFEGVFLLAEDGRILWQEPPASVPGEGPAWVPEVREALAGGRPTVTGLTIDGAGQARLYLLVPVHDWEKRRIGMVGAAANPANPAWEHLLAAARREGVSADLVDGRAVVIASTRADRLLRESAHAPFIRDLLRERRRAAESRTDSVKGGGAPPELVAFVPLTMAPWGVIVRQDAAAAFAAARVLRRRMLVLGPVLFALAVLFALGAARSVTRPLALLRGSAQRIAAGDIAAPMPDLGEDEVGRLGRSLETMRRSLQASLEEAGRARADLERRVRERTRELEALYAELRAREAWRGRLLRKVISAQEEERKRIARELHDETCQTLTALALRVESAGEAASPEAVRERLADARKLAERTLDEVHRMIFDLRPSVLDDLGLLSAIRWYAARQLEPLGIAVRCEFEGLEGRLAPEVETALFRAVQEALNNVGRHAEAENVLIQLAVSGDALEIEIEDDGRGFDPARVEEAPESGRGLGLLGIRERLELLGGSACIESAPGRGTRVVLRVPQPRAVSHA